jgi:hypothetical protein
MANKRTTPETPEATQPSASAGARGKKRVAPTIDLTATEMPSDAPPPPPPLETEAAAAKSPEPPSAAPPPASGYAAYGIAIAAGFAGAVIAAAVIAALWSVGVLPAGSNSDEPDADIVALQKEVQALQSRPAPDTKALDALRQSVRKLEGEMADMAKLPAGDAGTAQRLAAADNAMKSLGVALASLSRRTDDVAANAGQARERADAAVKAVADLRAGMQEAAKNSAGISPAELDALQKRIAELEQSAKLARADIAKASSADIAARQALSAAALRDAVTSGAPFAAELAQAKSLGGDAKALAPLAPFAASGVPAPVALAQELRALLPAMLKISGGPAPDAGFLARLQASAGKLVHVRSLDAPPGDDPSAVLARLEIEAAKADIAAALTDLGKLPAATRAPAQGWIVKAQARQAALAAVRQYAAATARALGPR